MDCGCKFRAEPTLRYIHILLAELVYVPFLYMGCWI